MSIVFIALLIVSVFSRPESKREVEQSGGCSICQLVVTYVEEYIGQNQTEQEIIQNLDNLCNQLPMFQSMCVSIVASYAPKIIEWILKNENPQAFCSSVGLCSARSQMKPRKMLMQDRVRPSKTNKRAEAQSGSCSVCQLVVTYVEEFIKTNQTEQEIIDNLDGLCSQLPIFQDQCVAIVGQYAPELIQWVLDNQNPQAFCANVGLCGTRGLLNNKFERNGDEEHHRKWKSHQHKSHKHKTHKHKSHKHKSHKGGVKMEDKINEDQATIQDTVMVANEIVEQTKAIIKSKMIKKGGFKKHPSFRYTNSNSTCSLCQELVAFVQELIARDNTIKQIIEEIRAVCYQIPPPDQQMCLDAVNQEIDALIQWIQDGKHPLEFCTYINVC